MRRNVYLVFNRTFSQISIFLSLFFIHFSYLFFIPFLKKYVFDVFIHVFLEEFANIHLSTKIYSCLNIWEINHEDVNEKHDHLVHEMKMTMKNMMKLYTFLSSWYYIVLKKIIILIYILLLEINYVFLLLCIYILRYLCF